MTPESKFSKWFCEQLRKNGAFVQRIETSTGNGVPDLWVGHWSTQRWVELKWNTLHIRPEQYVWANQQVTKTDVESLVVIGWVDGTFSVASPLNAHPKTKSYVLQQDANFYTYERKDFELFMKNYF